MKYVLHIIYFVHTEVGHVKKILVDDGDQFILPLICNSMARGQGINNHSMT